MAKTVREVVTSSPEDTVAFGRMLAGELRPGAVVFLEGDLGAGKTTLMKGIAAGLGAAREDEVTSPTFVLVQEYRGEFPVYHVDLYRVEQLTDLESLGLGELAGDRSVVVVEWPERLGGAELEPTWRVRIEMREGDQRAVRAEGAA